MKRKPESRFSSRHAIYQFIDEYGGLDDLLLEVEEMVKKWAKQDSNAIKFRDLAEIKFAALLLMDDLLPLPAKKAFASLVLSAMEEADKKKYTLDGFWIKPPQPGRKKDPAVHKRFREVKNLVEAKTPLTKAFEKVAKNHHKSIDSIRRDYERIVKKQNDSVGKIKK